ncbi:MAG: XdhC family protein [Halioglobus sp.]|nr:XdhC family protein [Halioglobus sp.]
MQTIDHEVLRHARDWLAETRPWLCTIVRTLGSSPRPVGSVVVVTDDGRQTGSVSGGCVEEDLLARLRAGEFSGEQPELVEYGVSAAENERLGLPCGGRITLLLQRLAGSDSSWLDELLHALEQRRCVERHVNLAAGTTTLEPVDRFTGTTLSGQLLQQCFGPRMRMLLVGAGELARSLAELGLAMDYEVIVTDPRQQFLDQWEGPDVSLLQGMPDDIIRDNAADQHSIVITLTHDPRIDDMALMEALESDAWYVGALGSQRTTEKRLARLGELGINEGALDKLHAPVGLDIGSKTPIEIAVSIMAQLTQLRRVAPPNA